MENFKVPNVFLCFLFTYQRFGILFYVSRTTSLLMCEIETGSFGLKSVLRVVPPDQGINMHISKICNPMCVTLKQTNKQTNKQTTKQTNLPCRLPLIYKKRNVKRPLRKYCSGTSIFIHRLKDYVVAYLLL